MIKRAFLIATLMVACHSEQACLDHECTGTGGSGGHGAHAGSAGSAGSAGTAGSAGSASLATQYCDCMLTSCHDEYHQKYGPETDEVAARNACLADAASVPSAGSSVTAGNFIECRIHHCQEGASDPSACTSSVGQGECQ